MVPMLIEAVLHVFISLSNKLGEHPEKGVSVGFNHIAERTQHTALKQTWNKTTLQHRIINKTVPNSHTELDPHMPTTKWCKLSPGAYILVSVAHNQVVVGHTLEHLGGCQMAAVASQNGIAILLDRKQRGSTGQIWKHSLCPKLPWDLRGLVA